MTGLFGLALAAAGGLLLLAFCAALFWAFAAAILWAAGRVLPLGGHGRRRD